MGKEKTKLNYVKVFTFILIIIAIILCVFLILNKDKNINNNIERVSTNNAKIVDTVAPTLSVLPNATIVIGENYIEDAKATDDVDGDITSKIQVTGEVDTNTIGTYNLSYSVEDDSGNKATANKEVTVCDELKNGLPVLMYHFFYDENERTGPDNNWIEIKRFEEHVKYLSEENFYFPSWEEVENYIDGKSKLPEKSVVITVDDGDDSFFELAVPIIQKYNAKATSFLITAWYGDRAKAKESNIYYESHSDDMHEAGSDGQGRIKSWSYEQICNDVKVSSEKLGGSTIFCYPFGHYSNTGIQALQDTGFKMAFTVNYGRVKPDMNKFELPRIRVSSTTTLSQFKNLVN